MGKTDSWKEFKSVPFLPTKRAIPQCPKLFDVTIIINKGVMNIDEFFIVCEVETHNMEFA